MAREINSDKNIGFFLTLLGLTSLGFAIVAATLISTVIFDDRTLDIRTWSLIFLVGGLAFLFALTGYWVMRLLVTKPTQNTGSDTILDEIAKWHRSAELLSKGVQMLRHDPTSLLGSLIQRSSIEDNKSRDSTVEAVALINSIKQPEHQTEKVRICSGLNTTPLKIPILESATTSLLSLRDRLKDEDQKAAIDALEWLQEASNALTKHDAISLTIQSLKVD